MCSRKNEGIKKGAGPPPVFYGPPARVTRSKTQQNEAIEADKKVLQTRHGKYVKPQDLDNKQKQKQNPNRGKSKSKDMPENSDIIEVNNEKVDDNDKPSWGEGEQKTPVKSSSKFEKPVEKPAMSPEKVLGNKRRRRFDDDHLNFLDNHRYNTRKKHRMCSMPDALPKKG